MFLPSNITLKFGDSGDFVAELQRRLAMVRCFDEAMVNGHFDGATVNGVTSFQGREGLHADGVAGPETLRRLNGVVAGDSSGSSDKKEEAAAITDPTLVSDMMQIVAPTIEPFAYDTPSHSPYGEDAYKTADAPAITAPVPPPPMPEANLQQQQDQQRALNDMAREQMLQQQQPIPQPLQPTIAELPPREPSPQNPPLTPQQFSSDQPKAGEPLKAAEKHAGEPLTKSEAVKPELEKPAAEQVAAAAEPKGIVGRIRHYANAVVQKLAEQFETKLPPSVLKEVQSIGISMAQSGMRENPIPAGPDLPTRAPDLPTRGPEQQPQQRA